jgi:hypothetical protein
MRVIDWFNRKLGIKSQVGLAAIVALALILVGTVVFHRLEDWSWTEAFYYSVITLSTVGYGDLTPTREATQIVAAFYILVGVTIFVSAIGIIGMNYIEKRQAAVLDSIKDKQVDLEARIAILERMGGIVREGVKATGLMGVNVDDTLGGDDEEAPPT